MSFTLRKMKHNDLAESEHALVLEKFCQLTIMLVQGMILNDGNVADKSCMIIVTDACLPLVASGETPLLPPIFINYELPTKKETYLRLMSTCLAAGALFHPLLLSRYASLVHINDCMTMSCMWDRDQHDCWR